MAGTPEVAEARNKLSKKKVARGTVWAAIDSWTQHFIQIAAFIVMGNIVGPETFGVMSMAMFYVVFIHAFLVDGFSEAIIQRFEIDREHLEVTFWSLVTLGLIGSIVSFAGAGLVAAFFSEPRLMPIIEWLSIAFVFVGAASLFRSKLRRALNFRALAVRAVAVNGISAALGIYAALAGYGIWALVAYQLCLRILDFLLLLGVCRWLPRFQFSWQHLRDLYSFGTHTIGSRVVDAVAQYGDRVFVGYFLDAVTLGLYGLAARIVDTATYALSGVLGSVALPAFAKLQNHSGRLANALYAASEAANLITFPVFAGLTIVAPSLVETFLGPAWSDAAPLLQILCFAGYCHSFGIFLMASLRAIGKAGLVLRVQVLTMLLRLGLCVAAVPFGATGIAVATVAVAWLMLPLRFYLVYRALGVRPAEFARGAAPAMAATILMATCVGLFAAVMSDLIAPAVALALLVAGGVVVYGAALLLLARSSVRRVVGLVRQS